jgi:hypothetical protein
MNFSKKELYAVNDARSTRKSLMRKNTNKANGLDSADIENS